MLIQYVNMGNKGTWEMSEYHERGQENRSCVSQSHSVSHTAANSAMPSETHACDCERPTGLLYASPIHPAMTMTRCVIVSFHDNN